jgi:hypothetical protein
MVKISISDSQSNLTRVARERLLRIAGADAELAEKVNELARPMDVFASFMAWSRRRRGRSA